MEDVSTEKKSLTGKNIFFTGAQVSGKSLLFVYLLVYILVAFATYQWFRINALETQINGYKEIVNELRNDISSKDGSDNKGDSTNVSTSPINSSSTSTELLSSSNIFDIPPYKQKYSASCEYASLHAAMSYYGVEVSEDDIAKFIGVDNTSRTLDADGTIRWGNPQKAYVGDMNTSQIYYGGYGIYNDPLKKYLDAKGFSASISKTNWKTDEIYNYLKKGFPVVVWISNDFSTQPITKWIASDGSTHKWMLREHAVVLRGVDNEKVYFMDVGYGYYREIDRTSFERGFANLENMAIVVIKD